MPLQPNLKFPGVVRQVATFGQFGVAPDESFIVFEASHGPMVQSYIIQTRLKQ